MRKWLVCSSEKFVDGNSLWTESDELRACIDAVENPSRMEVTDWSKDKISIVSADGKLCQFDNRRVSRCV